MIRVQLGQTGQYLTAVGLGAMPLTMSGRPDRQSAIEVIHCFAEGGGSLIDTANVYTDHPDRVGENETLVAEALSRLPESMPVMVATKGGLRRTQSGWEVDASPACLQYSCDASLQALGTECIPLYQLHAPDPDVDIRESVAALHDLQVQGKITHIGLCNVGVEQIEAACEITTITTVQNALHPRRKKALRQGVVGHCRQTGISFIAHSPVGGYHRYQTLHQDSVLLDMARRYHTSPACLSLAWLLSLDVIPIPGARRCASVQASLSSMALELTTADAETISALEDW